MFNLHDKAVSLVDYVLDPNEKSVWQSWDGIEGLISMGAEEHFGLGTAEFLRKASEREAYMRTEIMRRYGLQN
jgi:hypothetical protein